MTTGSGRLKEAIKICDITGSRTKENVFLPTKRLLWMKVLSSTYDWPETVDRELCHYGLFSLSQHEFNLFFTKGAEGSSRPPKGFSSITSEQSKQETSSIA